MTYKISYGGTTFDDKVIVGAFDVDADSKEIVELRAFNLVLNKIKKNRECDEEDGSIDGLKSLKVSVDNI